MKRATSHMSQQRVATALTMLSRLALRTSALRFRPQGSGLAEQWAAALLKQLLALCDAHQGAMFVTKEQAPNGQWLTVLGQPAWSVFTCLHWREEEAYAALKPFAVAHDSQQWSGSFPVTVCWKRSLFSLFSPLNGQDNAHTQIIRSPSVVLLLRWSTTDAREQEAVRQHATQLLPALADLVDIILLHILTAHTEEEPLAEALPADLLATIGHELRGPLTTIQGYAETLLRHEQQLAPEERREFLQAISQASAHVGALVNRFLELAQFETQTHTFLPVLIDMHALAQESIAATQRGRCHRLLLLPALVPTPQTVVDSLPEETPPPELTVSGDRRLLRNMLDILLENALVYSAPESLVEISLTAKTFSTTAGLSSFATSTKPLALILPATFQDQEPLLEICVQDHGRGIPPEELSAIFRRFYRGDTRLTREVNGLGLGLALCKAIVEQHRGMLWVESVQEEGSAFHILLPRGDSAAGET